MLNERINLIREAKLEDLRNPDFVERLIPDLGLYPSSPCSKAQFPRELSKYFNSGMRLWQYPNQLSKFAVKLLDYNITSYLEIGHCECGTLIFLHEYLKRFNPVKSIGIDICTVEKSVTEYMLNKDDIYIRKCYSSCLFDNVPRNVYDLILIDADHTYDAVKRDFNLVRDCHKAVAFHDIVNANCRGVIQFWDEFKNEYGDKYDIYEFIDQYDEVTSRMRGNSYLGIGLAVLKN